MTAIRSLQSLAKLRDIRKEHGVATVGEHGCDGINILTAVGFFETEILGRSTSVLNKEQDRDNAFHI